MVDIIDVDSGSGGEGTLNELADVDSGSTDDTTSFLLLARIEPGQGVESTNVAFIATESGAGANLAGLVASILGSESGGGSESINDIFAKDFGFGSTIGSLVLKAFDTGHSTQVFEFAPVAGTITIDLIVLGTVDLNVEAAQSRIDMVLSTIGTVTIGLSEN